MPKGMTVKVVVKYFSSVKMVIGKGEESYEVGEGETVGDIWTKILKKWGPEIEKGGYVDAVTKEPHSIIIAMNRVGVVGLRHVDLYDGLKTELKDGDVIAMYPPLIGG